MPESRQEQLVARQDSVALYGLLYFCTGNIRLVNPVIRDVWLPYDFRMRNQEDTAVLVVGGNASVSVIGGVICARATPSTAIAALDKGVLSGKWHTVPQQHGQPGVLGVFARGDADGVSEQGRFRQQLKQRLWR